MSKKIARFISALYIISFVFSSTALPQAATPQMSGKRYKRVVVRNAIIINGNGVHASGPKDIVIENDVITEIAGLDPVAVKEGTAKRPAKGDVEIDASGKYVMPGLINLHGHTQDERGGMAQPVEYCMKLWLACGITTVRDVGSSKKTLAWREQSAKNEIASPRLFAYGVFSGARNAEDARAKVRDLKQAGYDGIKLFGVDRDVMQPMMDEAKKLGMRVAHHTGVEETNTWDDIRFGTTSIEHWYGIPDAAIESGRQNFPSRKFHPSKSSR